MTDSCRRGAAPAPAPPTTGPTRPASRASSPARRRSARSTASERPPDLPRLPDRRSRRARHVPGGREPALDRRLGSGRTASPTAPDPGRRPDRPAGAAARRRSRWTRCGPPSRPGARRRTLTWPPTVEQARALTAFSPSALAAFARLREGKDPIEPDPSLDLVEGFLYQLNGRAAGRRHGARARRLLHRRRRARLQRLDVHRPGHHLDAVRHRVGGLRARSGR